MNSRCCAMSMVEVIISLVLFSAVLVAVMQTMLSTTNYVEFDATRSDLQTESMQFQNRVINDLANAAWFYKFDYDFDKFALHPVTKERIPLFPLVSKDRSSIEFIKLRTSLKVAESPIEESYAFTNFREPTNTPVDFNHFLDAKPTALMVMNPKYKADPQWFVAAAWESHTSGLDFDENQNPEYLRHYLYAVETDTDGSRNLVRKYINGYVGDVQPPLASWTLAEVLLRNVVEVEFTTRLEDTTDKALTENQIRVSVLVEETPQGGAGTGVTVKRRIEFTAAMRSINQEN